MTSYNFNRFHGIVFVTFQFCIMFNVQQIFPIFLNLVPKWRCLDGNFSDMAYTDNCSIYNSCSREFVEFEVDFFSAAIEFGWICTGRIGKILYFFQTTPGITSRFSAQSNISGFYAGLYFSVYWPIDSGGRKSPFSSKPLGYLF